MRPTGSESLGSQSGLFLCWFLCSHFIPSFVSFPSFCNVGCCLPMSCSATFCHLAGVSAVDQKAAASTPPLPPIDSLNVWDLISGANATSPRREWALTPFGEDTSMGPINRDDPHGGDAAYMLWPHKLIVGAIQQSGWCGEVHPNNSLPWDSFASVEQCNTSTKIGCLFNVLEGA